MSTYDFTQAFINANDAVLNHVDAIEETRALSELIDACKERMAEIKPDAVELAQKLMAEQGVVGSEFEHKGKFYQLQVDETFEFAEKKAQSSVITKILKTLRDNFPTLHPNIAPDSVEYTVVCVD